MPTTDVIVLGVGTCGEDVALRLLAEGVEVTGIESRLVGGECPYFACLPTKAMIRAANLLQEARRADGVVGKVDVSPDWSLVANHVRDGVTGDWVDSFAVERFQQAGGRFVRGHGRFTGPRTVEVDGVGYEATRGVVIATGSQPLIPPIPGLSNVPHWTTRDAIQARTLPTSLIILGGGAVGCELGQVFARFGVDVTIIEGMDRLLPGEDPLASEIITATFESEGIRVVVGKRVESVSGDDGRVTVVLSDGASISGHQILIATGRKVELDGLGLDSAGLDASARFIQVDDRIRAAEKIWAIGDVTGVGMVTHVAMYQGSIAVADILGKDPAPADYRAVPRATFTDPEVGSIGLTEAEAHQAGHEVETVVKPLGATFRGWLHRTGNEGVIKMVVDRDSHRLLGATSVGPHGAEMLGMLSVIIRTGVPVSDLVDMIFAFPTFYGGFGEAIGAYARGVGRVLDPTNPPLFTD